MRRVSDWETRFSTYIASAKAAADDGGEFFCALFAAGAVEAVTGENIAQKYRGEFHAVADNLEETIDAEFPETPTALAQRADLAWFDGSVGVVVGSQALFVTENGLELVDRTDWSKAWSVARG